MRKRKVWAAKKKKSCYTSGHKRKRVHKLNKRAIAIEGKKIRATGIFFGDCKRADVRLLWCPTFLQIKNFGGSVQAALAAAPSCIGPSVLMLHP